MIIRDINEKDIPAVLDIYRPYITDTRITFEYDVPSAEDFTRRVRRYTRQFPWLVACEGGRIVGYGYASAYRSRTAYQWDCELSVYVDKDRLKRGCGRAIYRELLGRVALQGYYNAYGVVALPNEESVRLHEHFGFRLEGIQKNTGFKHGQWVDTAIYAKALRNFDPPKKAPVSYPELLKEKWSEDPRAAVDHMQLLSHDLF